jgi:hypothetical protein
MHGGEKCIQSFGRKPEGKPPLRRTRRGWNDNISMDLREMGVCRLDSSGSG